MKITRLFLTAVTGLCLTIGLVWLLGLMSQPLARASEPDRPEQSNPEKPTTELHVCSSGCPYSTIQSAVDAASSGDLIKVAEGNYTDIHLRDGITQVVFITKSLTIQGGFTSSNWSTPDPQNNPTILDAQEQGRGVYIAGGINVILEGFQIRNGNGLTGGYWGNDAGGGIYIITATAMISDNEIYSNYAESGGGITVYNAQITLSGNTIYTNSVPGNCGGVLLYQSSGTITGNTIRDNLAGIDGGMGVSNSDHVTIEDNLFEANTGTDEVGGLEIDASEWITITGNTIISNTGYDVGGGVFILESNDIQLIDNQIIDNQAESSDQGEGGGLYLESSTATIDGNEFRGNYAQASGGGIFDYGSTFLFRHNTVCENQAGSDGGGVSLGETNAEFNGNLICDNNSELGGGLALWESGEMVFVNDVIVDNQVSGEGSAISAIRVSPAFLHTTIARNSGGDGSAILVDYGQYATHYSSVSLNNTVVVGHSVGITVTSGNTVTINGILWDASTPITISKAAGASVSIQNQYTGYPGFALDGYHLTTLSDAIDRGVDAGVGEDFDGDARPLNAGYELGADEIDTNLPIVGLTAINDSPTQLGELTHFTATITGGTNVNFTWAFGDGTNGTGSIVSHKYLSRGMFTATVTATNSVSQDSTTTQVTIVDVPIAGLTATNDSPTLLDQSTRLTATITQGTNVAFTWDFGDGVTVSEAIADHVYPYVGIFTATLTATNSINQMTDITIVTIEDVPIAGLVATNDGPTFWGAPTTFTATITQGSNADYSWDFGDGETGFGSVVSHTYLLTGTYTAIVTATNSANFLTDNTDITVLRSCWVRLNDDPDDYLDIQSAVDASLSDTDVVKVAGYCVGVNNIEGTPQQVYLSKTLTIQGGYTKTEWITPEPSTNPTTLDALGYGRVIHVPFTSSINPRIEGLRITGGNGDDLSPEPAGGGIFSLAPSIVISDCQIFDNSAQYGGGVYLAGNGTNVLANSEVYNNLASYAGSDTDFGGGGVWLGSGTMSITNNKIHNNHSNFEGGGLQSVASQNSEFRGNEIYDNFSDNNGAGVILQWNEDLIFTDNQVHGNSTSNFELGGGVYYYGETNLQINENEIYSNTAEGGGGIYGHGANANGVSVLNNQIYSNTANNLGGGLAFYNHWKNDLIVKDNQVSDNTSEIAAGIYLYSSNGSLLEGNQIINNHTEDDGGGIWVEFSAGIDLSRNIIKANQSENGSAGIYLYMNDEIFIENNLVQGNETLLNPSESVGIDINSSQPSIMHNTLVGNGRAVWLRPDYMADPPEVTLRNNIIVSHTVGIELETGASVDMDGTLWGVGAWANNTDWVNNGALVTGTVNLWVDPGFLNPPASDFHITTSSAAKDAGVSTDVYDDVDGEARPFGSGPDIGFDEWATSEISAEPGNPSSVQATVGTIVTTVEIPTGAVTETTIIQFTALASIAGDVPSGFAFAGLTFDLDAYISGVLQEGFVFNQPVTLTIEYTDEDVYGLDENSLKLYYWDGLHWMDSACGAYDYHPDANWFAVPICHLSQFALFGEEQLEQLIYLPLVLR